MVLTSHISIPWTLENNSSPSTSLGPVVEKTISFSNFVPITEQNSEHPLKNVGILFSLT